MDDAVQTYMLHGGYLAAKRLPGDRVLALMPLTFGRGRLCVGRLDDQTGYDEGW